eukprot:TRINITY_DN717_c0_g2_i1.p1 TRINITY_DN717_c0_g2~~TRINITY_DN717_c0_g2_i1.p1  ORF type:complete len:146 (-),score=3.31 TRINITY_DN717_c0_g2_i1:211-648(-)
MAIGIPQARTTATYLHVFRCYKTCFKALNLCHSPHKYFLGLFNSPAPSGALDYYYYSDFQPIKTGVQDDRTNRSTKTAYTWSIHVIRAEEVTSIIQRVQRIGRQGSSVAHCSDHVFLLIARGKSTNARRFRVRSMVRAAKPCGCP